MALTSQQSALAVVPMLAYEDPATALDWLSKAFGFRERTNQRYTDEHGSITHAEMEAGRGVIMLASPTPDYQNPRHHRDSCEAARRWSTVPWVIDGVQVQVDDVDAHYRRAKDAGAEILGAGLEDAPYGRLYRAEDIEGHRWMFIQPPD